MRIALVNHRDWIEGGMDKVVLVHHAQLQRAGHKTALFTQYDPRNLPGPYRNYFPKDAERLHYRFKWKRIPYITSDIINSFYNKKAGEQFGMFLDRFCPDIVHVHGLLRAFSPSIYYETKLRNIPLIQTHHYAKLICPTGRLLKGEKNYCEKMPCLKGNSIQCVTNRCQQKSLARSIIAALEFKVNRKSYVEQPDLHLAPSLYLRNLLIQTGIPSNRLKHHPNFVDTDLFIPLAPSDRNGDYFFYFGRIAAEKGIPLLLEAFAPLKHLRLYLAGAGPLEDFCKQKIEKNSWRHINFLGPLEENELVPWIQNAKATILPSLWGEIFGMTIIESFACGCPVIGFKVGAISELIEHNTNGFLVESQTAEALRESVLIMASLPSKTVNSMGREGYIRAKHRYTLASHMDKLLSFYKKELVTA